MRGSCRSAPAILAALFLMSAGGGSARVHPPGAAMVTGAPVAPPGGFILYCLDFPTECGAGRQKPKLIDLTAAAEHLLESVQETVNDSVQPRVNPQRLWQYPVNGHGDCNTYALEKKRKLIEEGLPRSALLLAVARTESGEGHLVLVARTNRGDLVLDNRTSRVLAWTRFPYRWIERQSESNPAMWVEIETPGAPVADATRGGALRIASADGCGGPSID